MKTSVFMASLVLGAFASCAFAADFSVKGKVVETVEASDNYFLVNAPSGPTFASTTAGTLDFLARTPTTSYLLDTNYSYYKYFGPGAADTALTLGTPASARFTINHATELSLYNIAASWTRADEATTQLAQSGVVNTHGSINTYAVNGGVTHDLGRIDTILLTAQASNTSFTDSAQSSPYNDVTSAVTWSHDISPKTMLINALTFDWFSENDTAQSQRLFWTITTGLKSQLTPRLTFNGRIGVDFANSYQNSNAQSSGAAPLFEPQVGAGNGWLGDATLTYDLLKTTKVTLTAAHATIPLFTGALQTNDTMGLSVSYDINYLAKLSFSAQFSFVPASHSNSVFSSGQTSNSDFFSASVNYGYQLSSEWRANLSYTFHERNDDTGIARSSTISLALSRDFTVLGNPTAINKAEEERARQRATQTVGQVFPSLQ